MRAVAFRATVAAAALSIALGAAASAATPAPDTLGMRLSPAPVRVDDGDRTLTATNLSGGLTLSVELTTSAGYAVEPTTFTLPPDGIQTITVTAVDPAADGTIEATATSTGGEPAAVRSAIQLSTRFVHATFLETYGGLLFTVALGGALLLFLLALILVGARRRRAR